MSKVPPTRRPQADDDHSHEPPLCENLEHEHMQEKPPRPLRMVAVTDYWLCPEHDTIAVPWEADRVLVGTQNRARRRAVSAEVKRRNRKARKRR